MWAYRFDRCCEAALGLDDEEFDLFTTLLSEFIIVPLASYEASLSRVLAKVPFPGSTKISVDAFPLIKKKDRGKTKSGTMMVYPFQSYARGRLPWSDHDIRSHTSIDLFAEKAKHLSKSIHQRVAVVLDDFIGTGDTALTFVDDYKNIIFESFDRVIFVCIAAMARGESRIKDAGFEIYSDIIAQRGITDCSQILDKAAAFTAMDKLEARIQIQPGYSYGYGKSEGLISLIRTPNNTFPFFWCDKAAGGSNRQAMFRR